MLFVVCLVRPDSIPLRQTPGVQPDRVGLVVQVVRVNPGKSSYIYIYICYSILNHNTNS